MQVSRGRIAQWKKAGAIPYLRQCDIEKLTHGKLKAGRRPRGGR
jgi:hypothetical protein